MSKESVKAEKDNKASSKSLQDWAAGIGSVDTSANDAEWTIVGNSPVSRTFSSRAEFMDIVIDPFNNRMSTPLVPEVHALYAEGDTVDRVLRCPGHGSRRQAIFQLLHPVPHA